MFLRPVDILSGGDVPGPTAGLGEPLRFSQISLAPPQGLLGVSALGDVLDRAEHAAGPARLVPRHLALAVDDAHLAVRPNHAVFHIVTRATTQRLRHCPDHDLLIFRVGQLLHSGKVDRAFLRRQPKDAVGFV